MKVDEIQSHIVKEISALNGDGIATYKYLIDVSRRLDTQDGGLRREENLIRGCQARVWINVALRDGYLAIQADSDARIVLGIAALLVRVLNNQPPETVANAELFFIEQTGLSTHLSPHRANGLAAMVDHIKAYASEFVHDETAGAESCQATSKH